jgi:hypothetical protein
MNPAVNASFYMDNICEFSVLLQMVLSFILLPEDGIVMSKHVGVK